MITIEVTLEDALLEDFVAAYAAAKPSEEDTDESPSHSGMELALINAAKLMSERVHRHKQAEALKAAKTPIDYSGILIEVKE